MHFPSFTVSSRKSSKISSPLPAASRRVPKHHPEYPYLNKKPPRGHFLRSPEGRRVAPPALLNTRTGRQLASQPGACAGGTAAARPRALTEQQQQQQHAGGSKPLPAPPSLVASPGHLYAFAASLATRCAPPNYSLPLPNPAPVFSDRDLLPSQQHRPPPADRPTADLRRRTRRLLAAQPRPAPASARRPIGLGLKLWDERVQQRELGQEPEQKRKLDAPRGLAPQGAYAGEGYSDADGWLDEHDAQVAVRSPLQLGPRKQHAQPGPAFLSPSGTGPSPPSSPPSSSPSSSSASSTSCCSISLLSRAAPRSPPIVCPTCHSFLPPRITALAPPPLWHRRGQPSAAANLGASSMVGAEQANLTGDRVLSMDAGGCAIGTSVPFRETFVDPTRVVRRKPGFFLEKSSSGRG